MVDEVDHQMMTTEVAVVGVIQETDKDTQVNQLIPTRATEWASEVVEVAEMMEEHSLI